MSAKLAAVGLPEMKVLMNKDYDVIISVYDVTNKILLQDSSNVVAVVMWPKFGNGISMRV